MYYLFNRGTKLFYLELARTFYREYSCTPRLMPNYGTAEPVIRIVNSINQFGHHRRKRNRLTAFEIQGVDYEIHP